MEIIDPVMSVPEIELLDSILKKYGGHYFEFGCGGSTYHACLCPKIRQITSVESSRSWIETLQNNHVIRNNLDQKRLRFIYVDINADDNNWGYPRDMQKSINWGAYSRAITQKPKNQYDIVLIDGRFRVLCLTSTECSKTNWHGLNA